MPIWIKEKAWILLANYKSNSEEILTKSFQFFGCDDRVIKGRKHIHSEIKHFIRYAMNLYGVKFEEIASLTRCHRTTVYHSIEWIEDVSSVDKDFKEKLIEYLDFIKK